MQGQDLTQATTSERRLPKYLRDLIASGEISGNLDSTLNSGRDLLEQKVDNQLTLLIAVVAATVFIAAAIIVAYQVISFYVGYFKRIDKIF